MVGSTSARYYCELYDDGGSSKLEFTYSSDGIVFMFGGIAPAATRFTNGSGRFSVATTATCGSTWHGEALSATGTIPAIVADQLMLYGENLDVALDYFLQIHTDE